MSLLRLNEINSENVITMFNKHANEGYRNALPKIKQKTLVFGERTLMAEFVLADNSTLPDHSHPYEQTGFVSKGIFS